MREDSNFGAKGSWGRFWRGWLSPTGTILPHTCGLLTPAPPPTSPPPPPPPPPTSPPPPPPPPTPPPVSVSLLQQCSWPSTLVWYGCGLLCASLSVSVKVLKSKQLVGYLASGLVWIYWTWYLCLLNFKWVGKLQSSSAKLIVRIPPRLTSFRMFSSESVCSASKKVFWVLKHYF